MGAASAHQLLAREVAFELAEGLVLLVAHAGDGHAQLVADLGDGPAAGPHLDDAVLAVGEDGAAGVFEEFAELLAVAPRLVHLDGRAVGVDIEGAEPEPAQLERAIRLVTSMTDLACCGPYR